MPCKYKAAQIFDYLRGGPKRGQRVFVGDHQDAERCKFLRKTKVQENWPSQWRSRFPEGYIEFADHIPFVRGRFFDLESRTINGKEVFIFEWDEAIDILSRRLSALRKCQRYAEILPRGDLLYDYAQFVLSTVDPKLRVWRVEDWARRHIQRYLPALGLRDLELLVEAARPSEEIAAPSLPLKAS